MKWEKREKKQSDHWSGIDISHPTEIYLHIISYSQKKRRTKQHMAVYKYIYYMHKYLFEYKNAARMILSISHKTDGLKGFLHLLLAGFCVYVIHFINRLISQNIHFVWVNYQVKDITHTQTRGIRYSNDLTTSLERNEWCYKIR